ncbi:MAG: chemoreceptor glutamine deamidase CheD [Burkholderiaceae bacterium]|nr:chemoreceptor glutamine deamidase CheD [Burkholderiaceae bacterium]
MSASDQHLSKYIYFDRHFRCMAARVLPGEFYFTTSDMALLTVLGSCVSACIRDRVSGIGGMNHFMLPSGGEPDGPASASMRYGAMAMEILINQLLKSGAVRSNLEAKVFGGGRVLSGMQSMNVGERNAQFVRDYLRAEQIAIVAQDLNDIHPRKVAYFPRSGRALVKKLESTDKQLVQVEKQYSSALQERPVAGEIELF